MKYTESKTFVETIHQLISDIDAELGSVELGSPELSTAGLDFIPNAEYRKHLVKTAYALRELETFMHTRLNGCFPVYEFELNCRPCSN